MPQFNFYSTISEIGKQRWQKLCGDDYPFLSYEFLNALEQSGSVSADTGWQPCHMVITDKGNDLAGMPLYLKNHSYGEYVFDWSWADAYHRNGLDYYPKLLTAIPYTPCYGPRLVFNPDVIQEHQQQLISETFKAIKQFAHQQGASGWHALFLPDQQFRKIDTTELNFRLGTQYHWFNRNYRSFDDFLAEFSSRKRKNLKKERKKIETLSITHQVKSGREMTETLLEQFYSFYHITYLKRGRKGYLTYDFFRRLLASMPDQLIFCFAYDHNHHAEQPVAGALFFKSSTTLYGRYWGCLAEYDSLHFETCYYQGIEYCIEHGISRFDPGAQGEHKIQRGFEPIETWSAHWLAHPEFQKAVERFVDDEEGLMRKEIAYLRERLPFRKQQT